MNELLIKHQERTEKDKYCSNCRCYAEEEYSRYIFWHKYNYCGEWCIMDSEHHIRRICSSLQRRRKKNSFHIPRHIKVS
jgi:hypothetical protein